MTIKGKACIAGAFEHPTRLASDGRGRRLYALTVNGDVWRIDLPGGGLRQVLWGDHYTNPDRGERNQNGDCSSHRPYPVCSGLV